MILSLFLPERYGNYFLLSKKVAGIQITKDTIYASVVQLKGNNRTVLAVYQESLEEGTIVAALIRLKEKLGTIHEIVCALPSSKVIFKELTLPFVGAKKVELVVPFEVEPLLPFNLEQGLIDSIIVKETENSTDVLVAAIKKEVRDTYIGYFMDAEMPLDRLTVDMFELYGLYKENTDDEETAVLADIGNSSSTMALIIAGELSYIRSFPQGKNQLDQVLNQIKLTADTTLQKQQPGDSVKKIILSGAVTDEQVPELSIPVELFTPTSFTKLTQKTTIPGAAMISLAAAASPLLTDDFTLLQEKAQAEENQRISRQLITAAILLATLFISFSLYSFFRVRNLSTAYTVAEQEAVTELRRHFKLKGPQTLMVANRTASKELKKQETAWRRISPDNRYAYLKYLAALTKCIDKNESRLEIESIILKDDTIKLYGSVPEYHYLPKLQKQLECRYFMPVAKLQDPNFKTEPITLTVNPKEF